MQTHLERVARQIVDQGFTPSYDYALRSLQELPFQSAWRGYNPEDTVRFYTLRLNEAKGSQSICPQQIIADHTDWRFFNELKRELKG